jgi:hypothetical protein
MVEIRADAVILLTKQAQTLSAASKQNFLWNLSLCPLTLFAKDGFVSAIPGVLIYKDFFRIIK